MDVGKAQVPHTAKLQMSLPMHHGGMGLIELTPEVSLASYLSCAAQMHEVLREAAQPLQIFEGARGERLQQQWSALVRAVDGVPDSKAFKDAAACLWTEEQRAPTEEVIEKSMPHAQRLVKRHQQDAQRERLMAKNNIMTLTAWRARRRRRASAAALATQRQPTLRCCRLPIICVWPVPLLPGSCASATASRSCLRTTQASATHAATCCTACATQSTQ
jgi:hypothetical protein